VIDRIDEYLDGLLTGEELRRMEEALAADPVLRAELEEARRFRGMLEGLGEEPGGNDRATARRRVPALLLLGAFLVAVWAAWPAPREASAPSRASRADGAAYGARLAELALSRRRGLVPRRGLADLAEPQPAAFGRVFAAGLAHLGIALDAPVLARAEQLVADYFRAVAELPRGVAGESERARLSLDVYRRLRNRAGRDAADAYYDMFRPGLVDEATATRATEFDRESARYRQSYEEACARLRRRYGDRTVARALDRLAPSDARDLRRDASQDGIEPDAVLAIRAELYRAAAESDAARVVVVGG